MIKLQKYYETKQKEKAGGKLSERKWLKKKKKVWEILFFPLHY